MFTCVSVALPMVNGLELYDVTHNTMRARWSGVQGVSGYMVLYAPLTEDQASDEKEVPQPEGRKPGWDRSGGGFFLEGLLGVRVSFLLMKYSMDNP